MIRVKASPTGARASRTVFGVEGVSYRYPGAARYALRDVTVHVREGRTLALLGPNGSGKSTLVRALVGLLRPLRGVVRYEGRPVEEWDRRELARRVGVVSQEESPQLPVLVREAVAMGRYPHLGPFRLERAADRRAVERAMRVCDVDGLSDVPLGGLSAGERKRVRIARALAQEPRVFVLDEPTASLDVRHEMEIFELLGRLTAESATVLIVTHNLNLAARYADRLLLLDAGRVSAEGPPEDVLDRGRVQTAYGWPVAVTRHPGPGPDAGAPQVVALRGDGACSGDGRPARRHH